MLNANEVITENDLPDYLYT